MCSWIIASEARSSCDDVSSLLLQDLLQRLALRLVWVELAENKNYRWKDSRMHSGHSHTKPYFDWRIERLSSTVIPPLPPASLVSR